MSSQTQPLNVGITKPFPCSYLENHEEQLLMLVDSERHAHTYYPILLERGFRRSGDQVYRPHCEACQACQSLRIPILRFKKSRSQRRIVNKNKAFTIKISEQPKNEYYNLYETYINIVHCDGAMFPASIKQYNEFINSTWNKPLFIEIYDQEKLISVSVTDQVQTKNSKAWSAFYCFYDPNYRSHSLGKFAVLSQISLAKAHNVDWLYLGYYIKQCQKMNYKTQFIPHQRFINNEWIDFNEDISVSLPVMG